MESSSKKDNPFTPQTFSKILFSSPINLFLAFVKFPFMMVLLSLSYAYSIFATLIPFYPLKRFISNYPSSFLFRIILGMTGILSVKEQPTPLADSYSENEDMMDPQPGDIIITNCASYLNLFWLQYKFSPIYVIPCDQENVYVFNVFQLLALILLGKKLTCKLKKPLSDVVKVASDKLRCPIVIFPEGSVTNGKFIINFMDFGSDLDTEKIRFHIFGFMHDRLYISPNFTFGNGFLHLFSMSGRFFSEMKVKMALPQDVKSFSSEHIDSKWIERCRCIISKITSLSLLDISGSEFQRFRESENDQKHHYD